MMGLANAGLAFQLGGRIPETEVNKMVQNEIKAKLGLKPGMVVADIGAGEGRDTQFMSSVVGPKGKVYSVEIAPAELEKIRKLGLKNVIPTLGSKSSANLPPKSVDAILLKHSYHHFTDPKGELSSLFSALKPGGKILIIDQYAKSYDGLCFPPPAVDRSTYPPSIRITPNCRTAYESKHAIMPLVINTDLKDAGFVLDPTGNPELQISDFHIMSGARTHDGQNGIIFSITGKKR
jgi:ubiquinone/menaquinone biosynthesis C-methylase UbiE